MFRLWLLVVSVVALGCGSTTPTPPPVGGMETSASPSGESGPGPANEPAVESPAVSTPTSIQGPPTKQEATLRDLAARLVVSDGGSGWRIDEAPATELEKLGPRAANELVPLMRDPSAPVRRGAAFYLLGKFDPSQADHVAGFARLLDDEDQTLRGFGLSAVKQMHRPDQISAVPRLAGMLTAMRETKPGNREAIARLIGGLKRDGASAADSLATAAADDPDAKVRAACLAALVQVSEPAAALAPLANGLGDADPAVRLVAAAKLESFGTASAPAAKQLAAALADSDQRVGEKAAGALHPHRRSRGGSDRAAIDYAKRRGEEACSCGTRQDRPAREVGAAGDREAQERCRRRREKAGRNRRAADLKVTPLVRALPPARVAAGKPSRTAAPPAAHHTSRPS